MAQVSSSGTWVQESLISQNQELRTQSRLWLEKWVCEKIVYNVDTRSGKPCGYLYSVDS